MKDSTVLQRQIPPLARRMFEGLKQFIALDIPFRAGERTERLSFIQAALDNPVVSPAEKLRQVLDGYAVESEYGRKIDTYKDTILIDDQERDVNILRIGRLVLAYQTSDLSETGIYNKETQSWESLPSRYRNSNKRRYRDGLKKVKTVRYLRIACTSCGGDTMKTKLLTILFALLLPVAYSQEEKPDTALSLEQLLELVQQGKFAESEEATEREQKFAREKKSSSQLYLLMQKLKRSRLEAIATQLEARFEANDAKLVVLEEQLKTRLGSLYETFWSSSRSCIRYSTTV